MYYFVYVKPDGENRFSLANPNTLSYGIGKVYAPRFTEDGLERLKSWVDTMNTNYSAVWQIRTVEGRIVYPT